MPFERMALEVERGVAGLVAIALHLAGELAVDQMEAVGLEPLEAAAPSPRRRVRAMSSSVRTGFTPSFSPAWMRYEPQCDQ